MATMYPRRLWVIPYVTDWEHTSGRILVAGKVTGTVEMLDLLNIHPDVMTYTDFSWDGMMPISLIDFLDVTGDGLLDAIIIVGWCDPANVLRPFGSILCPKHFNATGCCMCD